MEVDKYAHLSSAVHSWDVRIKLISLTVFILAAASVGSFPPLLLALGASILLSAAARLPLAYLLKSLKAPLILVLFLIPFLVFTGGKEEIARFWRFTVYREGVLLSAKIALKVVTVILATVTLFGTSKLHDTMKAMETLRIPSKLVSVFLFTYRYIFQFQEERKKYLTSARLRGFEDMKGIARWGATLNILVTLLLRSFEQSEDVYNAMALRGFTGSYPTLTRFSLSGTDFVKAGAVILLCGGIAVWEVL